MAKKIEDLRNPKPTLVIPFKTPNAPESDNLCKCGCGQEINLGLDSYIIIDDMLFWDDSCVTDHFIKDAGGRRVYGGAC